MRAGMAADPAHYRWSSYRCSALGESDALLAPHPPRLALGAEDDTRRAAYRELLGHALEGNPSATCGSPSIKTNRSAWFSVFSA